jgi:predicted phosphoribosyltransferase
VFTDRREAGRRLAVQLSRRHGSDVVVLGLPRGGVPVAAEVAAALGAPLDVLVVRKVGVPWQPELALAAVGEGGAVAFTQRVVEASGLSPEQVRRLVAAAAEQVEQVTAELRGDAPALDVKGRTVVVVDDGVATGATARAAAAVLRHRGAGHVLLAVPVASPEVVPLLEHDYDELVVLEEPARLHSVGEWYRRFGQVSTAEARDLLVASRPG